MAKKRSRRAWARRRPPHSAKVRGTGSRTTSRRAETETGTMFWTRWEPYAPSVEELNGRVKTLREDLEAAGVERDRLKTTGFDVHDDRRYDRDTGKRLFSRYEALHRLRLGLPIDKTFLSGVLARVAASASEAAMTISFDVSDTESLRRGAMQAAVATRAGRGPGLGGSLGRSARS